MHVNNCVGALNYHEAQRSHDNPPPRTTLDTFLSVIITLFALYYIEKTFHKNYRNSTRQQLFPLCRFKFPKKVLKSETLIRCSGVYKNIQCKYVSLWTGDSRFVFASNHRGTAATGQTEFHDRFTPNFPESSYLNAGCCPYNGKILKFVIVHVPRTPNIMFIFAQETSSV